MLPVVARCCCLVRTQLNRNCVALPQSPALILINKHDTTQSAVVCQKGKGVSAEQQAGNSWLRVNYMRCVLRHFTDWFSSSSFSCCCSFCHNLLLVQMQYQNTHTKVHRYTRTQRERERHAHCHKMKSDRPTTQSKRRDKKTLRIFVVLDA